MLSVVFKHGAVEVAEDTVSISDNFKSKPAPRRDGTADYSADDGKARVINASPAAKKNSGDNNIILEDELDSSALSSGYAKVSEAEPYIFPSLAEKESQYEAQSQQEIKTGEEQPQYEAASAAYGEKASLSLMCEEMLQKAVSQASSILEDAHANAQADYMRLMDEGRAEIARAKAEGLEEGIRAGTREQVANIRGCIEQLERAVAQIEGGQEEYFMRCEQDIKWLSLEICEKILNERIEADELNLMPLVLEAVAKQRGAASISVEISDTAPKLLQKLRQELEKGDDGISITTAAAPLGTCRIQTPEGFIDASLYRQIDNLKDYFSAKQL